MNAPTRYCHPCKANGVKTAAYETAQGFNGRARVEGKIVNVCPMHRDALTVVRAEVAGKGAEVRQATEGAIFTGIAEDKAARKADLMDALDIGVQYLTQTHLTGMLHAAGRERNALLADALYDEMFKAACERIGTAIFNGRTLTAKDVDSIVWIACHSNSSERSKAKDVRLDMPVGDYGRETLGSIIGDKALDTAPVTWRVFGVGNADAADMAAYVATTARPATITPDEWAALKANYATA